MLVRCHSDVYIRTMFFEKRPEVPQIFDPLTDPEVLASIQLYLVAIVEHVKKDGNGHHLNIVRAFREIVAETSHNLNQ